MEGWLLSMANGRTKALQEGEVGEMRRGSFPSMSMLECLALFLGMEESSWVRVKGRAGTGDLIYSRVCYRLLHQEDQADETLSRQTGAASQAL